MKKYKYKVTPKLESKCKKYWNELKIIEEKFYGEIFQLERKMEKELKIKGIEFFFSDNDIVGIGNAERTMELLHRK